LCAYTSNSSTSMHSYLLCAGILCPGYYRYRIGLYKSTIENYFERKSSSNAIANGNVFLYMYNYVSCQSPFYKKRILRRFLLFNINRWSIKPIYGLLTDFVPICGYHRFLYLLGTTAINLLAWLALYLAPIEYDYLLVFCLLAAFSLAFNDVLSKSPNQIPIIFNMLVCFFSNF
jgi:hypothetical protein